MVMAAFNAHALGVRLRALEYKKQLAFGILCCERMIPNYFAFQQNTGWGDHRLIRGALDYICTKLEDDSRDIKEIMYLTKSCEEIAPSSENFSSPYVTFAQDACFAICSLLDFLIESDVEKIVQAAIYTTDSVDLYIQEKENMCSSDPLREEKILLHQLMQRELIQQEEDLKAIELVNEVNQNFLLSRKLTWNNNGKSNLDLPNDLKA